MNDGKKNDMNSPIEDQRMISRISRRINEIDPSYFFLAIAILVGGYIRLSQVFSSDFPLNDGGFFYTMIKELMANRYQLPEITSYNHLNLPFAYPPLFLYISGFLDDLTSWGLLNIIRILPTIFSILALPAFYLLANVLIKNRDQVVFATYIFTFIPASFDWLIMGGGVTRSPAFFFALLSLYFIYRLYTQKGNKYILWTIIFSSLTILSHPETALHTAVSAVVFFLFYGRNKHGLIKSLLVAGFTLVITSPWWATVLFHNGLSPFIAAGRTGFYNLEGINKILQFDLTNEYFLQTIGTLGLIGLFWYISERNFFYPVWLLVIFISDPRSAPLYLSPCIAILASYSLINILNIFNKPTTQVELEKRELHPLSSKVSKGLFLLLSGQWFFSSMAIIQLLISSTTITTQDKNAFDWIKLNTSSQSKFLVLTGKFPLTDPISEWFPAFTDRTSVATVQGREWDSSNSFDEILTESTNLQACILQTFRCIESWASKNHGDFDYLFIRNPIYQPDARLGSSFESALGDLSISQGNSELVYKNVVVSIYKVK